MKKIAGQVPYYILPTVDSTSSEVKRLALKVSPPFWLLAFEQTGGRGRFDRKWISGKDNFYSSFIYIPDQSSAPLFLRSFVCALAIFDVLIKLGINPSDIKIKWPNDLLIRNKKVSGILLETTKLPTIDQEALIVGVGVNLISSPHKKELPINSLESISLRKILVDVPSSEQFLMLLIPAYKKWEQILVKKGFGFVRNEVLEKSIKIGTTLVVKLPDRSLEGTFQGIGIMGGLLLKTNKKTVELSAGEIIFPNV